MALTHTGLGGTLAGIVQAPQIGRPRLDVQRTKFFGLAGESEIGGGRGGRPLMFPVVIHGPGYTSAAQLVALLNSLDQAVGTNGTLTDGGAAARTYPDCTFEGFEVTMGPLPDVGGSLGTTGGWFVMGNLHFYQLLG